MLAASTVVPIPRWTTLIPPVIVPKVFEPCVIASKRLKASVPPGEPVIRLDRLSAPIVPPLPSWNVPASIRVMPVYEFVLLSTIVPAPVFTRLLVRVETLRASLNTPSPSTERPLPETSRSIGASPSATSNVTVNVLSYQFEMLAEPRGIQHAS